MDAARLLELSLGGTRELVGIAGHGIGGEEAEGIQVSAAQSDLHHCLLDGC